MTEPKVQPTVLKPDQLDVLRREGRIQPFESGEMIFAEGDRPDFAVIIDRGKVKLTVSDADTGHTTVLGLRRAGDLIGEFGCIAGVPRAASIIALTPVVARIIPSSKFLRLLMKRTDILLTLFALTIARLRESDQRRLEFGAYPPIDRAIRVLLDLVERHGEPAKGGGRSVTLQMYQHDLASVASVSRETVVRTLHDLTESGVISTAKGKIVIHDLELLRAIVSRGRD